MGVRICEKTPLAELGKDGRKFQAERYRVFKQFPNLLMLCQGHGKTAAPKGIIIDYLVPVGNKIVVFACLIHDYSFARKTESISVIGTSSVPPTVS